MLKNISNLKGAEVLSKKDQKTLSGGRPTRPCGETGGVVVGWSQERCFGWGIIWANGRCYICY
ncbi:MAG: hypothetical protein AAF611_18495 [Bacteroidota bacterium]